jgi:folate-binding protein YgfZ
MLWPGGFLMGTKSQSGSAVAAAAIAAGAVAVADGAFQALRVESGWPLYDVDFNGSHLPQEIGREAVAVHFHKGCYLGQETIARIDALGHVNKRLATVRFAENRAVSPGCELTAKSQPVGHASSIAWSPQLKSALGLAMVRRGANEPGNQLACMGVTATVIETPAVAPMTRLA